MKPRSSLLRLLTLPPACLLGVLLAWGAVRAADPAIPVAPPAAADAAPVVKVLFMGADVAVLHKGDFHRVRGVEGGDFVLEVGGRRVKVPLDDRGLRFKVLPSLKLAAVAADVDRLRGDRTYTSARDPRRQYDNAAGAAAGAAAAADIAMAQVASAQEAYAFAEGAANAPGARPEARMAADQARARLSAATEAATPVFDGMGSGINNPAEHAHRAMGDAAEGNFDAMAVEFTVSSPVPLERPHVVVVTRYRPREAPTAPVQSRLYARELDPLGERPRKVSFRQGGFPPGFELLGYEVHLYDGGEEVATSVSPKRVPLAADEAFQFLVLEHITGNKGATLPAEPVVGQLPADLRVRLAAEQFERTYYIKVGADGRARGAFADKGARQPVRDEYLAGVLGKILFKPALEKGRPVESVCPVRLADVPE